MPLEPTGRLVGAERGLGDDQVGDLCVGQGVHNGGRGGVGFRWRERGFLEQGCADCVRVRDVEATVFVEEHESCVGRDQGVCCLNHGEIDAVGHVVDEVGGTEDATDGLEGAEVVAGAAPWCAC